MPRLHSALLSGIVFLALTASSAHAQIVESGPVNGLTTFTDINTGLVWVDLDNFFGKTYNEMKTAVEAAGFTVADVTQVHGLLDNLTLNGSGLDWDGYAAIMGKAPNRDLIWGAYLPEATDVSWAFAYRGDTSWSFEPTTGFDFDTVPNDGTPFEDMDIWAFQTSVSAVPEPGTMALLCGLGVAGVGLLRRRRSR